MDITISQFGFKMSKLWLFEVGGNSVVRKLRL